MLLAITITGFYIFLGVVVGLLVLVLLAKSLLGIVVIGELEVGIVAKKLFELAKFKNTSDISPC